MRWHFGEMQPPTGNVICYYFRRVNGRLAERVNITLTAAEAIHFGIWANCPIDKARADRIKAWGAKQGAHS